ncbi:NAD(P)H-hydrate dehydratase [Salegentibacter sp. F188]|uniref:Bifunctional NAD(P)H-hydrate repair enzyme n=1 Tax=Autumnicola patrickiae TaxID=3075591 RepID=A0ABU3E3M7_9FLAO|nr:NAD(P)H-hydrate dehydratase [Salegentibacter sp. F188]MDT0690588.1 NAD(P)H-hydrate dehydratase [Salegentibacter sp. F188]
MKILTASQLKEADEITIEKQNISSEELMERAATQVFNEIHTRLQGADILIKVFCGIGNNGGDGLVIARLLIEHSYNVKVFIVNYSDNRSKDFLSNYDKIKNLSRDWPVLLKGEDDFPDIKRGDFVIDAIFGIGLNRPLEGWVAKMVNFINDSSAFVLSVDLPSGLFTDKIPEEGDAVIMANFTLSFQTPKLVFFLPDTMDFVGDMQVLEIGLDREFLSEVTPAAQLIGRQEARSLYNPRNKNSHKGSYGHVIIVGGSYGKIGSIVLATTASMRTGAGLATVFIPKCGYEIVQTALPEAMVLTDVNYEMLTDIKTDLDADVVCFGMGAGRDKSTVGAFKELLKKTNKPMVIDADGLNILSENNELLQDLPENSVLTPHPKELERLIGEWKDDFDKIEKVQEFIKKHKIILVLKGAHTFVFEQENIYVNNTGNAGMATAGSGDVLSGVIAGLISQKYEPLIAAVLGVYLHGKSGDISAEKLGYEGIISGDIAKNMGLAFRDLMSENETDSGAG